MIIQIEGLEEEQVFTPVILQNIFHRLKDRFDTENGGFGGAPKFPGTMNLDYLLQYAHIFNDDNALKHAELSLDKMIMGGIYDQIGGGFARYSVDAEWLVPHFEKMLYDNALLVSLLSDAYRQDARPLYEKAIRETLDEVNTFFEKDWPAYQKKVEAIEYSLFKKYDPIRLE